MLPRQLVAVRVLQLQARGIDRTRVAFLVEHATEDIKHTNLIVHWILDVVTRHPDSASSMLRAFDCFARVYPEPVWDEALQRANRHGS